MKIKTSSKEITATLNAILKDVQDMSFKDLVNFLQHSGVPYGQYLPSFLVKNDILKVVKKGVYTYCGTKPLYYKILDVFLEDLKKHRNKLNKASRDRLENNKEDYCIKYLKARGYKIMKEITEYKEV